MILHEPPMLYSVDLTGCTAISDLSPGLVAAAFVTALRDAGATVVQEMTHNFRGNGLTCVLILSESHAVIHTWPETGTVNIDIFSCSSKLRSLAAIDTIARVLGATSVTLQEIARADGHRHQAG